MYKRSESRVPPPIFRYVVPEQAVSELFVRVAVGGERNSDVFTSLGKRVKRRIFWRLSNLDVSGSTVKFVVAVPCLFQNTVGLQKRIRIPPRAMLYCFPPLEIL